MNDPRADRPDDPSDPELAAILAAVDGLSRPEPRPGGRARLIARLDAVDGRRRARRRGLGLLALAGSAAGVVGLTVLLRPDVTSPSLDGSAVARIERIELAEDLELYDNLDVVEHLDVLPDLELIERLPEESG